MNINILEYLEKTASTFPEKIALIDGKQKISFKELRTFSKILSLDLIKLGFLNKPIAVLLPKSTKCVIADIAITYSGNMFMNLDIKTPVTRIGNILGNIQPIAIITNLSCQEIIPSQFAFIKQIIIEEIDFNLSNDSIFPENVSPRIIDTDPWCIINTSGSTGTPKGVVLNHKSYIDYTEWAINTFHFTEEDILGVLSPTIFDHYNYEICLMMAKGCTLVLLDNLMAPFPVKLLESLKENDVTYIFWVPSIMVNIANMDLLRKISLPSIRMVWFAGEVFPTRQFNYWKQNLSYATFVNLYGPVEASVDCTYYVVERDFNDDEPIPIGNPCRNTDILILNTADQLSGIYEEGELCIRGTSLAMGYYNNPDLTKASFIQNPFNKSYPEIIYRTGDIVYKNDRGEMVFKGRKDSLIKHMGYRIELNEIEHIIIDTLKLVDSGCVLYNKNKKEITLFYQSKNNPSISEMKKTISEILPKYMIPTRFHKLNVLPRTTSGKIDRLNLNNLINNE